MNLLHPADNGEFWPSSEVPHQQAAVDLGARLLPEAFHSERAKGLSDVAPYHAPIAKT